MDAVRIARGMAAAALAAPLLVGPASPAARTSAPGSATVTVDATRAVNHFRPDRALGAGVDGHDQGSTRQIYTSQNERAMLSAGLRPLTYRLRTELGAHAWHWNSAGTWSDPAHHRGYWTGSSRPGRFRAATYGYMLPRRGDTIDQANDDGWSRLDDGKLATFWKSNPYLDPHFTREPEARHEQWMFVDLRHPQPVDTLRIHWADPYARHLRVEYFTGGNPIYFALNPGGRWVPFPHPDFAGQAGTQSLQVADRPVMARFVRVVLTASSHTALPGSRDIRDRLGFAVRELDAGYMQGGRLVDLVRHAPSRSRQSVAYVSSTDPWHRASDIDTGYEQPSFQTVKRSGLANGQPLLAPVPLLYATPADSRNEVRYLHALGIPLRGIEMGEEPDGQLASPEDYGALYARFARSIRSADRRVKLGGPGYQTSIPDWRMWPSASGDISWTRRFLGELRATGAMGELGFFSFEWYPFDNGCAPAPVRLARAPGVLTDVLARQAAEGLPPRIPKIITEYGYSAFATRHMVDMSGALLNADIVGQFLASGGDVAYLYGYEPDSLISELSCHSWGNLILFRSDDFHHIRQPVATYWAARMITGDWAQPGDRLHAVYSAQSSARDGAGRELVTAYAVRRPDGRLAVILVNKDPTRTWNVRLRVTTAGGASVALTGRVDRWALTGSRYRWHAHGARGYASPDLPPVHSVIAGSGPVALPPSSLTVLRGALAARISAAAG